MLRKAPPPPDIPDADGTIPKVVPPLPRPGFGSRNLDWRTAFAWLRAGWADTWTNPIPSLLYGIGVFVLSALLVWCLFRFELDYVLFPALAGFLVIGPLIANGLYEKSRRLEQSETTSFAEMIMVKPASGHAALFMGVMLVGLYLLWVRAAVLIWALFFGIMPFPGLDDVAATLFRTPTGWALLLTGGFVGALFAAFSFSISVFAVPMLLEERTDAMSALGISMAMVWNNLPVMLTWGGIVLFLTLLSIATGLLGFILIFPVLGHATWHAYRAIRPEERQSGTSERMFIRPA